MAVVDRYARSEVKLNCLTVCLSDCRFSCSKGFPRTPLPTMTMTSDVDVDGGGGGDDDDIPSCPGNREQQLLLFFSFYCRFLALLISLLLVFNYGLLRHFHTCVCILIEKLFPFGFQLDFFLFVIFICLFYYFFLFQCNFSGHTSVLLYTVRPSVRQSV